jgi:nicotinate-nucleotide--dimethylbenzimidazole phosphoribosyltransferase
VTWERPVPLIGDVSAASQRGADPAGWAFPVDQRDALYAIVAARRDVRRFRADPVPDEVLLRVLGAAHAAPSVGHSQPWRFIVVRDDHTRTRAGLMADRERLRQAARLDPDASRRLLDLQLDGIREAPIGLVICCDRRIPAAGVLGRATFADADVWSCAAAIENLWLAARAEGLGLGWVTLFSPAELAALVGLPDGVMTLGWLCLGWPDERPPSPGLQRAGWSTRLPLNDVVLAERWPETATPPPPSHLAAPSQSAVVATHDDSDRLLTPPGSLGVLDRAVERVLASGAPAVDGGWLVLVAADHPVAARGVSAFPAGVTREVFDAAAAGRALGVSAARAAGLRAWVVDAGIAPAPGARAPAEGVDVSVLDPPVPIGDLVESDAVSRSDAERLLAAGRGIGRRAAVSGLVAVGEVGIGNTTVASCLAVALTGMDVDEAVGLGAGADSAMLARKRGVVRDAVARWRAAGASDPVGVLAALGGPEFAVLAGVVLGVTEAHGIVVLDGLATGVAALAAVAIEPAAAAHLVAGQRSRERAHQRVLTDLGCEPLLDLRIRAGEGVGACLAAGLLRQALAMRRSAARVDY